MPRKDHKFVDLNICGHRHLTRFALCSETSWSRNRISWNQACRHAAPVELKESQDVIWPPTCIRATKACRPICCCCCCSPEQESKQQESKDTGAPLIIVH